MNAHRQDVERHEEYRAALERMVAGPAPFAINTAICASVIRIVTHRGIFKTPSSLEMVGTFIGDIRARPNATAVDPGPRHWVIFMDLLRSSGVRGADVTDAWLAALAIESGCRLLTSDGSMGRFQWLQWKHPLVPG